MYRSQLKMRVMQDGLLEVVDPALEDLPLLREIAPDYRVETAKLRGFNSPRFQRARNLRLPLTTEDIKRLPDTELFECHAEWMKMLKMPVLPKNKKTSVSLLDIKVELARRSLKDCRLCGRDCGVNRHSGKKGVCGLGIEASIGEIFIHIAEEPPINPSLNLNLMGCSMRCRFCQKSELLDAKGEGLSLSRMLWEYIENGGKAARSISFIGGNPDQSLYSILRFLALAPHGFKRPVVWNSNGYASRLVYLLLDGLVDVYIPDAKFYSPDCSQDLAGCRNYFKTFKAGLAEMISQDVPVFIRMLVLPGHSGCCHTPMIEFLSSYRNKIRLNIMGQYYPDYILSKGDSLMNSRPTHSEVESLRNYAVQIGGVEWLINYITA